MSCVIGKGEFRPHKPTTPLLRTKVSPWSAEDSIRSTFDTIDKKSRSKKSLEFGSDESQICRLCIDSNVERSVCSMICDSVSIHGLQIAVLNTMLGTRARFQSSRKASSLSGNFPGGSKLDVSSLDSHYFSPSKAAESLLKETKFCYVFHCPSLYTAVATCYTA